MIKLLPICLVILILTISVNSTQKREDQDLIDISNITVFPQQYSANIRAGYLNISSYNAALYYIFCESQDNPDMDPVILWLNGGPGCSSLTGFFTENGPFYFKENDPTQMYINKYAWNKKANVIYLESPGTVGFSTATTKFRIANDTSVAKDNLKALQMFFDLYPQYKGNDFYIAGESYAGIYIPRLADEILSFNEGMQQSRINLRGILIGNACTHPYECYTSAYLSRFSTEFLYTRGFIEQTQYNQYVNTCTDFESSANCMALQKTIYQNFISAGANIYNIYSPCYKPVYPPKNEMFRIYQEKIQQYQKFAHSLKHPLRCTDSIGPLTVLNTNQFRQAFKVYQLNDTLFWTPCSDTLNYTMESRTSYFYLPTLIKAGLKVFYFSGDVDAIVPIQGTIYWVDKYRKEYSMNIKRSWRPWVSVNQNISGMVWELDGMTFATVRGSGHMVPSDKPAEAQQILNVFLGRKDWQFPDYYQE